MKRMIPAFLLWLGSAALLLAQTGSVTVEVALDQEQFMPNEEMRVGVRVTNFSGQQLQMGKENDWVTFTFQSREIPVIEQYGHPPVAGEFTLDSSMTATRRVNLAPYFKLEKPGRYSVTAHVKLPQWKQEIVSRPKAFDIVRGAKLKEVEFGVPQEGSAAPETRKYILQQADYLKEMKLYLRLTDGTGGRTYKVFPLARMVSFSRPEAQLDRFSNVHVLHQVAQRAFNYCVVNPDGQIITRQTHEYYRDSRPRLRMDDSGRISVHGGVRMASETDLPPVDSSPVPSVDSSPASSNTNAVPPKL